MIEVTIAIPVYNVAKYVEKSLLSALEQDFKKSFEVLVVDDCGTDDSMSIVRRIMEHHPKGNLVRILKHDENRGLGPARNTAIQNACGKYLFFLDSDDWISSNCLSVLYERASATNADAVVGSLIRVEENTERELGKNIYPFKTFEGPAAGIKMLYSNADMHVEVWNKLFKLDYLRKNEIGCVHRIFEDYNFDFKFRATADKIILVPDVTLYYNIRENSILTQLKAQKGSNESMVTLCDIVAVLQRLTKEYENVKGIYDLYFQRAIWVLENFKRYSYTEEQWLYIRQHLLGFQKFVPSLELLNNTRNRYVYKRFCEKQDLEDFYRINERINNIWWIRKDRFIRFLKEKLLKK